VVFQLDLTGPGSRVFLPGTGTAVIVSSLG
jgi:hypothetical protein